MDSSAGSRLNLAGRDHRISYLGCTPIGSQKNDGAKCWDYPVGYPAESVMVVFPAAGNTLLPPVLFDSYAALFKEEGTHVQGFVFHQSWICQLPGTASDYYRYDGSHSEYINVCIAGNSILAGGQCGVLFRCQYH